MNFTCNTCSLSFPTPEDQRSHMKSDWHRYNLKRRVAQLPCIDEDLFIAKVASLTVEEDEPTNKKKGEKQVTKKEQRRKDREALQEQKRQILETARKAMMEKIRNGEIIEMTEEAKEAKKEIKEEDKEANKETKEEAKEEANEVNEQETKSAESSDSPETKSDESSDAPETELTAEQQEELWIAEKLANKVEVSPLTCLFSHPKYNKNFETIDENIEHMFKNFGLYIPESSYLVDKEGLITYLGDKINFGFCIACNYQGKSAEAAREHMIKKRHMRIPYEDEDEKLEISGFYDFSSTYDDVVPNTEEGDEGAWEDVSDEGEAKENDDEDDEDDLPPIDKDAIYQDGHELVLPSGAVIGHRSMARYYRQNLAPERILSEGQGTVIAAETRLMINARDRKELATQKRAWNNQKKREDVNDRRAAKFINNQPHFRDPLLQ